MEGGGVPGRHCLLTDFQSKFLLQQPLIPICRLCLDFSNSPHPMLPKYLHNVHKSDSKTTMSNHLLTHFLNDRHVFWPVHLS